MCVRVSVCLSVPRKLFLGTIKVIPRNIIVIIINLSTVTASEMVMLQGLIILTLTFIQGHKDRNHENNKCSIISATVQVTPIPFFVKIVGLKVYLICSQSDDLALHPRSQLRFRLDTFVI